MRELFNYGVEGEEGVSLPKFKQPRRKPVLGPRRKLEKMLDDACSAYVKLRDNNTCQRCKKVVSGHNCQWSHLWSRRHRAVRWNPLNSCVHCYPCHTFLGGNPVLFSEWITGYLGQEQADKLRVLAMTTTKWSIMDLEYLLADLRNKTAELERRVA